MPLASGSRQTRFGCVALLLAALAAGEEQTRNGAATNVGYYNYESPHSNPIAALPDGSLIYVANTPADTVDVVDAASGAVVARVHVGIDPVGIAVRPDGREVWVSNHVSDSISVIDAATRSRTRHQVLATIQDFDAATRSTRFDEPVGIAFASNLKAYVALSSLDQNELVSADRQSQCLPWKLARGGRFENNATSALCPRSP